MTLKILLEFFEKYYGEKYSGVILDVMLDYLSGYSDEFYQTTASVIVRRFSRSFKALPSPAEIEKHMDEIFASMPKPEMLPEPPREITDEDQIEWEKAKEQIYAIFKNRTPSPMAGALIKSMEALA